MFILKASPIFYSKIKTDKEIISKVNEFGRGFLFVCFLLQFFFPI